MFFKMMDLFGSFSVGVLFNGFNEIFVVFERFDVDVIIIGLFE